MIHQINLAVISAIKKILASFPILPKLLSTNGSFIQNKSQTS
jgi:hypothetical protein